MSRIIEEIRMEERREALEEGRKEGRKEGEKQRATFIVQNLLLDGTFLLEKITQVSGLTYDEVKAIAESNKAGRH